MPVRLGIPQGVGGLSGVVHNPIYATGVGLVLYGAKARGGSRYGIMPQTTPGNIKRVLGKMKSWFQGNF